MYIIMYSYCIYMYMKQVKETQFNKKKQKQL